MKRSAKLAKSFQNLKKNNVSNKLSIFQPKKSNIAEVFKDKEENQGADILHALVSQSLITSKQLIEVKRYQRETDISIEDSLLALGYVDNEQISTMLSNNQSRSEAVDLSNFDIPKEILNILPKSLCLRYCVLPISKIGNTLVLAINNPNDTTVKDSLSRIIKEKMNFIQASKQQIEEAIVRSFQEEGVEKTFSYDNLLTQLEQQFFNQDDKKGNIDDGVQFLDNVPKDEDTPIVRLVNMIILKAIKSRVSDIHIEPYEEKLRVRFRLDGTLHQEIELPKFLNSQFISRLKVICQMDISEKRKPQDGRFKASTKNSGTLDFRVSILPTVFGEKCVLRLLDKSNLQVDMTRLGFESQVLQIFKENIKKPNGMLLVTGPTGSGKTTTLYSALTELNTVDVNLSTVEDPVEFNLSGINQVQVNPSYNIDFATILRSFLRQDPDIIMVGEIRDIETLEIAIKASLTGHLVLSTLHTNDAPSTLNRMIDMGAKPFMITASTNLIVAQRLIRKNCTHCATLVNVEDKVLLDLGLREEEIKDAKIKKSSGCKKCNNIGYKGRIAIFEVLEMNAEIEQACLNKVSSEEVKKIAIKSGMQSLRRSGLNKMKQGLTTIEEVINVTKKD